MSSEPSLSRVIYQMGEINNFSAIPIVDVREAADGGPSQRELSERLGRICHEVGFLVITGHGISQTTINDVFSAAAGLFELPEAQKRLIDKRSSPHFRGWEPVGAESTNNRPDIREQVDLWTEHPAREGQVVPGYLRLLGPNQWV